MNTEIQRKVETRAKLWQEFVANYQRVMIQTPEQFEQYCEEFRSRFLAA
jgi:hypothetical protein